MTKGTRVILKDQGRAGVVTKSLGNCLWVKMDDDGTEWSGAKHYWKREPQKRPVSLKHVFAIPTSEAGCEDPINCGLARTVPEAQKIIRATGHRIMTAGGNIDLYDAADGPGIYGYEADGLGAIGITVHEDTRKGV